MQKTVVYLDNAATTYPKPPSVLEAVGRFLKEVGASPGRSGHQLSRKADKTVFEARESLARLFNADRSERIVFSANATESLNLAIKGSLRPGDHVIISNLEHHAVVRPLKTLECYGVETTVAPVSINGHLDTDALEGSITDRTKLIVTVHASNVTGTILPITTIGTIARGHGIPYLVDAAQSAGYLPIDLQRDPIDLLTFTGHKALLGLPGTGGLYIREGIDLETLIEGGTGGNSESPFQPDVLPDRYESGTLNGPGIAGLGAGVDFILETGIDEIRKHELRLLAMLRDGLSAIEGVTLHAPEPVADAQRREVPSAALLSVTVDGMDSVQVGYVLDRDFSICVRSGLHCAHPAHQAIGTFPEGTTRLSIGYFNTEDDIGQTVEAFAKIARHPSGT